MLDVCGGDHLDGLIEVVVVIQVEAMEVEVGEVVGKAEGVVKGSQEVSTQKVFECGEFVDRYGLLM